MNEKCHEMILEKIHLSGVEEWHCPICGRHFLVQWPPAYKMIVVEPGEKDTRHNLSKVNSHVRSFQATQTEESELMEDFRLIPWLEWMDDVDFASRWEN